MSQILPLIAVGGAFGSVLRYLLLGLVAAPLGTVLVNVLGSLAIGVLFVVLAPRDGWQPFLVTGVLGGFTTFSAFSLDTLKLIEAGAVVQAITYVIGSVLLSLAAVAVGIVVARSVLA